MVSSIFFFLYLSIFLSSPNLSGRTLDVYRTSTHGVALVGIRMQVWNVLRAARWKCRTQTIAQNSPSAHHRTNWSGYVFATKARIDNGKKLLSSNISPRCRSQYGELRPTSGWDPLASLRHRSPANFNEFRVLAALLHGTLRVGVSQTLRRWTEGATYIWQGDHHVGH